MFYLSEFHIYQARFGLKISYPAIVFTMVIGLLNCGSFIVHILLLGTSKVFTLSVFLPCACVHVLLPGTRRYIQYVKKRGQNCAWRRPTFQPHVPIYLVQKCCYKIKCSFINLPPILLKSIMTLGLHQLLFDAYTVCIMPHAKVVT